MVKHLFFIALILASMQSYAEIGALQLQQTVNTSSRLMVQIGLYYFQYQTIRYFKANIGLTENPGISIYQIMKA